MANDKRREFPVDAFETMAIHHDVLECKICLDDGARWAWNLAQQANDSGASETVDLTHLYAQGIKGSITTGPNGEISATRETPAHLIPRADTAESVEASQVLNIQATTGLFNPSQHPDKIHVMASPEAFEMLQKRLSLTTGDETSICTKDHVTELMWAERSMLESRIAELEAEVTRESRINRDAHENTLRKLHDANERIVEFERYKDAYRVRVEELEAKVAELEGEIEGYELGYRGFP